MTEDDQVRRLLADARHTEPMPDDVAARLDGVLADLRADRPVRSGAVDLAAARRRRRARALLIAAAAVVVAGVGINQVRDSAPTDDASSADSGPAAAAERSVTGEADDEVDDGGGAAFEAESPSADSPLGELQNGLRDEVQLYAVPQAAGRVAPEDFGAAALRIRDRAVELESAATASGADALSKARCRDQRWGPGRAVLIRYDGSPAVLVYRPARGDTQVVDLFLCGRGDATRSITLPAR